jgi:hypothetical protein
MWTTLSGIGLRSVLRSGVADNGSLDKQCRGLWHRFLVRVKNIKRGEVCDADVANSKQLAGSELAHQCQISFQKIELRQVLGLGPLHVSKNAVLEFSLEIAHDKEA